MYKGKFHLFVCDSCHREHYTQSFPAGFIYIPAKPGEAMQHKHVECATEEEIREYEKSKANLIKRGAEFYKTK